MFEVSFLFFRDFEKEKKSIFFLFFWKLSSEGILKLDPKRAFRKVS